MSLSQRITGAIAVLRGASFELRESPISQIESPKTESETKPEDEPQKSEIIKKKLQTAAITTKSWMKQNWTLVLTIGAVLLGCILGFAGRQAHFSSRTITLISFPGEIFMRALKMFILPLIVSSLIAGMAQLDTKSSGKIGARALVYYMTTTIIAAVIGIVVVLLIQPGDPRVKRMTSITTSSSSSRNDTKITTLDAVLDIIRNLVPDNLIQATFQQVTTTYVKKRVPYESDGPNRGGWLLEPTLIQRDGTNVVGLIAFSICFGLISGQSGSRGRVIVDFFVGLNHLIMDMVMLMINWFAAPGIACLIAGSIMSIGDLGATARTLGLYMLTVSFGLILHGGIVLPGIYWLITRRNPAVFFKGVMQAWFTAMGTASCAATLPITFRCLEENNKIDPRITRFVASIGATINMDGTALYEAVAAIFIAQMNGISLGIGEVITVSLTATLASIGAASIPSAALITMVLVLTSLGLPTNDISLLFTVDWFLDRIRTSVNMLGDSYGAGIVYHLSKDELDKADQLKSNGNLLIDDVVVAEKDQTCIDIKSDENEIIVNSESTSETKI